MITETDVRQMLTPEENEALDEIDPRGIYDKPRPEYAQTTAAWLAQRAEWSESPQGRRYWSDIHERLAEIEWATAKLQGRPPRDTW